MSTPDSPTHSWSEMMGTMAICRDGAHLSPAPDGASTATHWSAVLAAADSDPAVRSAALEQLCRTYWQAVHAFIRQRTRDPEEARDLTQSFFATFLRGEGFSRADRARGRFRTYLLRSVQNFLLNEWRRSRAIKRGGGAPLLSLDAEPGQAGVADEALERETPELAYERGWALATLEQVMMDLEGEYLRAGKTEMFNRLRLALWETDRGQTYAELAADLGLSEAAVKMAVMRMRTRARELLRQTIANTVATPAEAEAETQHLLAILRR